MKEELSKPQDPTLAALEGLAVLSHNAVPVLVQTVDAPLLKAPFSAFLDRPDRLL